MSDKPDEGRLVALWDAGAFEREDAEFVDAELRRLHEVNRELLESLTVIQSQFRSMVVADWRKWEELASPEEFERWVKSRAAHMAAFARAAIAKATGSEA